MDTLPPTGDLSVDPTRDAPEPDGGPPYLAWSLGAAGAALEDRDRDMLLGLGAAVVRCWSDLPRDVQARLFNAASAGDARDLKPAIARFLHDHAQQG